MVAIGSVEDLTAEGGTHDEAGVGETGEFALHGADAGFDLPGDLAGEKGLVGGSEEERENLASGLTEKQVFEGWGCCTQNEYMVEESDGRLKSKKGCRAITRCSGIAGDAICAPATQEAIQRFPANRNRARLMRAIIGSDDKRIRQLHRA